MSVNVEYGKIWEEYQRGVSYNSSLNRSLYETVKENENFYIGNQWEGVNAPDIDKPVFNILRRVVTYFISSIVSDDIAVSVNEFQEDPANKNQMNMIGGQFAEIMEICGFKGKSRDAMRNAAVDGDGCIHYYFDTGAGDFEAVEDETGEGFTSGGQMIDTPGHIEAEVLDNTNVYFGDPQVWEIQKQPYVILSFRRRVEDVKEMATANGLPHEGIIADSSSEGMVLNEGDDKVTVLRKYYRYRGTVWYTEVTQTAVVKAPTDAGLKLYPIAWLPWERVKNSYHGQAAVTGMVPNQIFINKLFAMAMHHVTSAAFPKTVYNRTLFPDGWSNRVGAAIGVLGDPNQAVATGFRPPDMSNQVLLMIDKVMQHTRDSMGASDAALGNVRPDNTSAIVATQKATSMPLELQKMEFYRFIEESVRLWLEMMAENYGVRTVNMQVKNELTGEDETRATRFDFSAIKGMNLRLNVDIGASTYWSELMQVQTLDNLFTNKIVDDPELYIDLVPTAYIPNKQRILEHIRKQKAAAVPPAGQQMPGMDGMPPDAGGMPGQMMPEGMQQGMPDMAQLMAQLGGGALG